MRLERVEIVGFKSFCDKQELSFQGGVTGIVGPNGCGKSNISDAISWVLGEQSAKSLRGASMTEVDRFIEHSRTRPDTRHTHPIFGPIDPEGWSRTHFKHGCHHLQQFGLIEVEA